MPQPEAQLMIGRAAAPDLVPAIDEIEEYGLRNDGDADGTDGKAALRFAQKGLHAACGIEAERGTAGKHDRIRGSNRSSEVYGVEFTRPRPAPENGGRGHGGALCEHNGHAGSEFFVVGMANADASDVGNQIARSGFHGRNSLREVPNPSPCPSPEKGRMDSCCNRLIGPRCFQAVSARIEVQATATATRSVRSLFCPSDRRRRAEGLDRPSHRT